MVGCSHIDAVERIKLGASTCVECEKAESTWVHLRTCQTCGVTLCCNSSPNQHARAHFRESGHPVIASAEKGERWLWCYEDQVFEKY